MYQIHFSPHFFHIPSIHIIFIIQVTIISASSWYYTHHFPDFSVVDIIVHYGGFSTCACLLYTISHLVLIEDIWEVYFTQPVASLTQIFPVAADCNYVCWIWMFPVPSRRRQVGLPCCDMVAFVASLHSDLFPPTV